MPLSSVIFNFSMLIHILCIATLIMISFAFLRRAIIGASKKTTGNFEKILLLVPIGAVTPLVKPSIKSLIEQDYPNFKVVLISATQDEPSSIIIQSFCEKYKHVFHVVAGKANRCCQKNHNLLAGLTKLESDDKILVFCDSTHLAKDNFLSELVTPICENTALITSGYRYISPQDNNFGTICQMLTVQAIHMLQSIKLITQPWGGATAIRRSTFYDHKIPELWARTIVDDFTMGPYLQSKGIRSTPVAEACLITCLSNQTIGQWWEWFFRQMQYLKFGLPMVWVAATTLPLIFFGIVLYILYIIVCAILGFACVDSIYPVLIYFFTITILGFYYTKVLPSSCSCFKLLICFYLIHFVAAACLLWTWTTNTLKWNNIEYRVRLGGEVIDVVEPPQA